MLGGADQAVPVFRDVLGRAADLGDDDGDSFCGNHFDRVPRADSQLVRIRLLLRDVYADLATDAALEVDFAPLLRALHDAAIDFFELDAIDRAYFQARLATGAVVGVDDRQLLGDFFTWTFFGHNNRRLLGAVDRCM